MEQNRSLGRAAALLVLAPLPLLGACAWIGLTWGALNYPTTQRGETANVVSDGTWAYATRGAAGLEILNLGGDPVRRYQELPPGVESADDLALADGLLFVLDARPPGHLAVFSLADPARPALAGAPVPVEVGPFSGVAAAGGRVVVSGGTSRLSVRAYDGAGRLGTAVTVADLGRGQPDVILAPAGDYALVSTHDEGPHFSVKIAHLAEPPAATRLDGSIALQTYGFTPGGAKPANFPIELALEGEVLYVASDDGLLVVDLSVMTAPRALARLPLDVSPVNIDVRDGIAAVVGSAPAPALVFIDVRDPTRPAVLRSFPLPEDSRGTGVALTDSHAVVAGHGLGTLLFARAKGAWEFARSTRPSPQESRS
jgi:hypothetical protein